MTQRGIRLENEKNYGSVEIIFRYKFSGFTLSREQGSGT